VVNDPRAWHFPVSEAASQVRQYAQLVKTVYPNAAIGDVEPIIANAYGTDVMIAIEQRHAPRHHLHRRHAGYVRCLYQRDHAGEAMGVDNPRQPTILCSKMTSAPKP